MKIYDITEETTFNDVLASFVNHIKSLNIPPALQNDVKGTVLYHLKEQGFNCESSRGGVHYGAWWTLARFCDIKFAIKVKKTDKLVKISKLRKGYLYEFKELQWDEKIGDIPILSYFDRRSYLGGTRIPYIHIERFARKLADKIELTIEDYENAYHSIKKMNRELAWSNDSKHDFKLFIQSLSDYYAHDFNINIRKILSEINTFDELFNYHLIN